MSEVFCPDNLVAEIRKESKTLNLPENSINSIIAKVLESVLSWLENREIITNNDLERVVSCELDKYSKDLAFLYRHRNKII
ncbi:hypothetical protein IKF63_00030 [Candidatus Saccharibacteria bacterium]|nr:hypothetical protein [Candidatus Saccharibacteria bacterium]